MMTDAQQTAARNKANYLRAKAAFNLGNVAEAVSYYSPDHRIRSKPSAKGRAQIEQFLTELHQNWKGIQVVVEHAVAEDDWVMGRSRSTATHTKTIMGVPPTHKVIETTFWDLHRFGGDGLIAETWNLMDSAAIMRQLGLL
jgi:steroid delta-isomerase-like uncharacterized protein